jgi:3-phenylpropionate/trans-cinnamate dioxygenase ferredoxin subunit
MARWIETVEVDEIDVEDVIPFEYEGRHYALYRNAKGDCFATDGYCPHERVLLADGLVMGNIIECPKHNGRLDFTTGEPKRNPICDAIKLFPVKIENGKLLLQIN